MLDFKSYLGQFSLIFVGCIHEKIKRKNKKKGRVDQCEVFHTHFEAMLMEPSCIGDANESSHNAGGDFCNQFTIGKDFYYHCIITLKRTSCALTASADVVQPAKISSNCQCLLHSWRCMFLECVLPSVYVM